MEQRAAETRKVGLLGVGCNLLLAVLKLLAGFLTGSGAMTADGFNSAGDVLSSIITLVGNHVASEPGDAEHPYGHGKAEAVFSAVIGGVLLVVAWTTLQNGLAALQRTAVLEHLALLLAVAAVTLTIKAFLAAYCLRIGRHQKNPLVLANAEDHRADLFVTSGTVVGIVGNRLGLPWLDGVVGILVAGWIGVQAARILWDAYGILMDTTSKAAQPILRQTEKIVAATDGVDHLDMVRLRPIGAGRYSVIIKVTVPGSMSVSLSHRIAHSIEDALVVDPAVADVVIHVNPLEEHPGPSVHN